MHTTMISAARRSSVIVTPAWLMIPARFVIGCSRQRSCGQLHQGRLDGARSVRSHAGSNPARLSSVPSYRCEIPLESEERSAAVQVQRAVENLVTAELSEAGRAWRITTEHPMFKTARALGSARPSTLSCVPHGKPKSFQFPEGALIALYHFRDSVVAFQVDRRFDCLLQEASAPQRRESFASW